MNQKLPKVDEFMLPTLATEEVVENELGKRWWKAVRGASFRLTYKHTTTSPCSPYTTEGCASGRLLLLLADMIEGWTVSMS